MSINYVVTKFLSNDTRETQAKRIVTLKDVEESLSLCEELNDNNKDPYISYTVLVTRG
ncbi:hypothetical protein NVP1208B_60 [Vibrio phage 1.208.B._10N.222.52.A7]|nr:hypothetical protein NVP1208B_60 [Vibrio phage 1.208.B._10N.222.52.A7]